ncbi:MAG: hypothetical protein LBI27_02780 [Clostridiales bacterium]|jgi:hypothetical protein|nr:hypothetical protein [Clostridiales bacterium]
MRNNKKYVKLHSVTLTPSSDTTPNVMKHDIGGNDFVFADYPSFKKACAEYSSDANVLMNNDDFKRLSALFSKIPKYRHIQIHTSDYHFIPFEALIIERNTQSGSIKHLINQNPVSRRTSDIVLNNEESNNRVCIINCCADDGRDAIADRLINIIGKYKAGGVEAAFLSVNSAEDMREHLSDENYMIIHIVAHVEAGIIRIKNNEHGIQGRELRKICSEKAVKSNMVVITACGNLDLENEDNLFAPFIFTSQPNISAVVGMSRKIFANTDLSYLDAFYKSVFGGKTIAEAVRDAVEHNRKVTKSLTEENPLPMVYFGESGYRERKFLSDFQRTMRKVVIVLLIFLFAGAVGFGLWYENQPRLTNISVTDSYIRGRAVNLPGVQDAYYVSAVIARTDGELYFMPDLFSPLEPGGIIEHVLPESWKSEAAEIFIFTLLLNDEGAEELRNAEPAVFSNYVSEHSILWYTYIQ